MALTMAAVFAFGPARAFQYPTPPTTNVVDTYHGVKVADPYRILENPDDPRTREWIDAENKITMPYLQSIPEREQVKQRLTELWNYERYSVPAHEGGRYFLTHNNGLQNQSVIYTLRNLNSEPKLLLDPNTLSPDGTTALSGWTPSEDGKYLAYGLAVAGSDWQEWKIREIESGRDLEDHLQWIKFSGASWTKDGKGFFYSRYDEPNEKTKMQSANYNQKLFYHRVGQEQSKDALIYERPDHRDWQFSGEVTDDGRFLIITAFEGTDTRTRVFYKDLKDKAAAVVELLKEFDAAYHFIGNNGSTFWFLTDLKAPRNRIIAINTKTPEREKWKEIIAETKDTLRSASVVHDQFILDYMHDAHSVVLFADLNGKLKGELPLPGLGSVSGLGGKQKDKETFYAFTSFTQAATIYRYDFVTGKSTVFREPTVKFHPEEFETKQVFYASKDGTKIPMFVTAKKDLKLDGSNPVYLYGYGGFNISLMPSFSPSIITWLERGGVFAQPNLRGGGEYGETWHQAGMKTHKQNVFDDFISAAEWLIANQYTQPKKLAISGRSNGGLLVGACLTQRPDLFGAALPGVGVLDMLRFHLFTIGWAWTSDYGSVTNKEEFDALLKYSPLQNIRPGTKYPPTLITTADHDDRVVPAHSFKFAATLQAAQAGPAPILIRIETKAGHGAGKPISKQIDDAADQWAFVIKELGMSNQQPSKP